MLSMKKKMVLVDLPVGAMGTIAKPGCQSECGIVKVQYPFGIGQGCFWDGFELTCNTTYNPPKLFFENIEVYNISDSEMRVANIISSTCYNESGIATSSDSWLTNLETFPFTFSQKNKLTVVGCNDAAVMLATTIKGDTFRIGCLGLCDRASDVRTGKCSGNGCCQTSIPKGLNYYHISLSSLSNRTSASQFNPCGFAFLGEGDKFTIHGARDFANPSEFINRTISTVPIVMDWVIGGNRTCSQATECKGNSICKDDEDTGGYRCSCSHGYDGSPYLHPGCQDINECKDNSTYPCYGICSNIAGSYNCACSRGYTGNATTPNGCQHHSKFPALVFSVGLVLGLVVIFSATAGIYCGIRKRKLMKLREKFFEQNGGVFLKQKLQVPGASHAVTMFSTQELQKATDDYSEERIVGRGGYGVVYKGILADKRVVAIKKSKLVDGTQAEQFINEVLILTQVIHRNVVKLLGFCLEEEVPVLVYEFISNNTLFHHIHDREGGMSWLSWENRLRVAAEAAAALAYLHSQANMPIIHRDVKSANILLDENYTAKISDFGASRLVPLDHDQVTTLVQGTLGYLDPEYFNTSQLTPKSDVYSFGVVLAELITGQKPLCAFRTNDEKNLATYFVKSMKQNRLFEVVDPRVLREATFEQLQAAAELVKTCLNLVGENRPTMNEVAMELEGLRKSTSVQQQTHGESTSLTLEIEQSDL